MMCECGALDCRRCYPGNFRHGVYIGDMDEDQIDELDDAYEYHQVNRMEQEREDRDRG
jgi:hypothetical protein